MLKPAAAAAADFADDLLLLDFSDEAPVDCKAPTNPNPSSRSPEHFFQEILDATIDGLPGLAAQDGMQSGGANENEEEEEELEWLANKDAFPALETSFDLSVHSWSSSSAASADHRSPVSVLASALPFRAPARSRSKGQRRRRKALPLFPPPLLAAATPPPCAADGKNKRKCRHCESEETPQWRAGPDGPKTLCNACGVRFKSGRLVPEYRPANSPTFSAFLHSNSHRRVVEMRRKKYGTDSTGGSGHRRGRRNYSAELALL
ncbi:GATA transcription factor 1 [Platanthera guangdongensis]|uniref:GATA transcription factor 1 n=1 Tax=Platanthera guangdongensis TaxID=2320717 RepID=A0ABR2M1A0_9ASPA